MNPSAFSPAAPGRFVPVPDNVWDFTVQPRPSGVMGFAPDTLPPAITLDQETVTLLEAATLALGELRGLAEFLPDPELLSGSLLTREAIFSSRIEGTIATVEELALFGAAPNMALARPSLREVWNYLTAARAGANRIMAAGFGSDLMRDLHRQLMAGVPVRGSDRHPGEFRTVQNWIGPLGSRPESSRFVPPPPAEMQEALEGLVMFVSQPSKLPYLIRLPLVHYQFEAIHPFIDGNGRIGRMLISLLLVRWSLLRHPFLHLSVYFERHGDEYRNHLLAVSQHGAWLPWIQFFLRGVAEESAAAASRAKELWALRERYRETVQAPRASANLLTLVDFLFRFRAMTIPDAARHLGVTYTAARKNMERLTALGIVTPMEGSRARLFLAHEIVRIINAPGTGAVSRSSPASGG